MASSRSGSLAFAKPPPIHQKLLDGDKFLKWTDQENTAVPVTVMVEKNGFFLYYFDQKDREVSTIDLCQVRDVRTGSLARTPKDPKLRGVVNLGHGTLEDKTVTIVYGVNFVDINFINFCSNKIEVAATWCSELWKYIRSINPLSICSIQSLRKTHTQLCLFSNSDKPFPVRALVKYFAQGKEDRKTIEKALDTSGLPSGKGDEISKSKFGFDEFQTFYKNLLGRPEVTNVLNKFSILEPNRMSSKEFLTFLNDSQRDPRLNEILHPYATEEKAVALIQKYEPNPHLANEKKLSVDGFMWFLMSEDNLVMSTERLLRLDNMEAPLAHYFIESSHNTYLTGHQITGRSSVEMYRQVLLSGCRCIELDFWNGEDVPHITHGYTMVNKLSAEEVIQAIAECAFKTSEYPLVLSFENHCNPKQQAKIAEYCKKYFGEKMIQMPLESHPLEPMVQLPSPEQLKEKILVKNKVLHHHHTRPGTTTQAPAQSTPQHNGGTMSPSRGAGRDTTDLESNPPMPAVPPPPPPVMPANGIIPNMDSVPPFGSDSSDESEESEEEDSLDSTESPTVTAAVHHSVTTSDAGTAGKESKACAEISALVNYVMPVHFRTFEYAEKRKRSYEMSSFVETHSLSLLKQKPEEFVKYNRFQTSRVYPRGTRVESSNFLPQTFWNAGCQLVALNYQTLDVPMQLNLGIFQYNRRTGYLLKPDFMCREDRKFDPFTETSVDGIVSGTVSIQILSGQFLTDKHVGTYVEVEMYGLPRDTVRRGKFRTKTVQSGIAPVFNEDSFVFRQVILPDLAKIRIAAFEESGSKLIGHRVLPMVGLCPGYRHIPLFNEAGQPLHLPCLFVHITVGDYVPNSLTDLAEALANPIKYQSELERRAMQLAIMADEEEERNREIQEAEDSLSMKGTGGSTPECASPTSVKSTVGFIKRTGSSKPGGSKDGSPTIGPHRTDSAKSLATSKEVEAPVPASLETVNLTPDSLERVLEHRTVKEKQAELAGKLDQLRKKKEKEMSRLQEKLLRTPSKPKNPLNKRSINKIVKAFSTVNLETPQAASTPPKEEESEARRVEVKKSHCEKKLSCERNYLLMEKDINEKYLESIFQCAEKVMTKSQSSQLKSLENLHSVEANDVMKRLEQETKVEEQEKGSLSSISREDRQRERRAMLVRKGVTERGKLQELYSGRRAELESAQEKVRQDLKNDWEARRAQLAEQYKTALEQLEAHHS